MHAIPQDTARRPLDLPTRTPTRTRAIGLALVGLALTGLGAPGCDAATTPTESPEPTPAESPGPTTESAAAAEPESGSPGQTAEPEPESESEPARPTLADGRPIEPCGDAPDGMACIPGGPFVRGTDDGPENARPAQTVELQTFFMDVDEVTSAEYKRCKQLGACPRRGPLYNDFSRDRQPIVGVSWYAAVDFCMWKGKHLPTEAEWEKAARGPDGEANPFGDAPVTCENAVIADARGKSCGVKKKKEHPDKGRTFVVGSRPAGRYGLNDMAGNAWEWVADWATDSWAACGTSCQGVDPRGPCDGARTCPGHDKRVVKGGSWYWKADRAQGWFRRTHYPENEIQDFHHFGFRCAASLEEAAKLRDASTPSPDANGPDGAEKTGTK